jgi:hypothetical protein
MIDLFTIDFQRLENDVLYGAISEFARVSPNESNRHDFKLQWTEETMQAVAAFANTFGGILLIGVEKSQTDVEPRLTGVSSTRELMTSIASSISTNISPTPIYDIAECHKPAEANTRFCVVRVRNSSQLYLVTKKNAPPVWVRDADRTIRANAAHLRRLIEREKDAPANLATALRQAAIQILDQMTIGRNYQDDPNWPLGTTDRSEAFFRIGLVPSEQKVISLDRRDEIKFVNLIHEYYRRVHSCLSGATPVARDYENRSAGFYEYRWFQRNLNYENRWRITDDLFVGHASQIEIDHKWSLADIVVYTILLLKTAAKWWESLKYVGDGLLVAQLYVMALPVHRGTSGQYLKLFGPGEGDFGLRSEVMLASATQRLAAVTSVPVNFASMRDDIPRLVTALMNPMMRDLGYALLTKEFEENIGVVLAGQRP